MILQIFVGCWLLAGAPPVEDSSSWMSVDQGQDARRPVAAQSATGPAMAREAEAYYQFMLGRHLESEGDVAGAIQAYGEASKLDPKSAEILAELSGLYARENKIREAMDTAASALNVDANNVSAHRVLGIIYSSLARVDDGSTPLDAESTSYATKAAEHLEAARKGSQVSEPGLDLTLGRIYVRTGARDKAIGVLSRLVVDEPGRPEPISLLVQAYQQAGRSDEAITLLESVVVDQPQFYASLGELYEKQQRWPEAASAYERAMARNPKSLELPTRLAIVLLSSGDEAKAGRALDLLLQVRQQSPADSRVLYLLAQAQRTAGKLDDSETTARELMTIAPGSLTGPYALALVLEQKQQYRRVVEALEPIVSKPAASTPATASEITPLLVHLGFAYLEIGDVDRALSTFERARTTSPQNPAIDAYVIQAQLTARRYADAAALARKVRASRPGDQRVLRLAAEAFRKTGNVEEGAALLAGALTEHPDDVSAYLALAEFDTQNQQYDAALRVLDQAAARFPSDLNITFQMGSVLERQKRFADAERKFRDVLAKDPLHAPALNYLGYMLAARGERLDESIGYIQRALQVEPYNGAYLDSLGWAYYRQNKLDLAEVNLRRAAEQRIRDSAVQDHFGDLLFKLGRYQEAVSAWQRALDGDGEPTDRVTIDEKIRSAREKVRKN
ncbi:MAG TPA: tetratricopeptide repeat protein [Vicinamibacterales bacterium]